MGSGASKVAFREVVQEVGEKDISGDDKAFWNKLWRTETNPHVRACTAPRYGRVLLTLGNESGWESLSL